MRNPDRPNLRTRSASDAGGRRCRAATHVTDARDGCGGRSRSCFREPRRPAAKPRQVIDIVRTNKTGLCSELVDDAGRLLMLGLSVRGTAMTATPPTVTRRHVRAGQSGHLRGPLHRLPVLSVRQWARPGSKVRGSRLATSIGGYRRLLLMRSPPGPGWRCRYFPVGHG